MVSETFANRAVAGSVSYPTSGANGTTNANNTTLTVAYNASTQGYTITAPSRSQVFLPSHIDAALSGPQLTVYKRTSGSTTDSLTLSRPGTSGPLTYKYVGSGYWQRTVEGASTISATIDGFVYGVKTPDATLRRTGAARYGVDLQGVYAYLDLPVSLLGTGTLDVDFETQRITTGGSYNEFRTDGTQSGSGGWEGTAILSSSSNFFNGTMRVGSIFGTSLNGMFFGPDSDEVGAAFAGKDNLSGISVAGTLLGRKTQELVSTATNKDLVTLTKDVNFISVASGLRFSRNTTTGAYQSTSFSNGGNVNSAVQLGYKVATQTYSLNDQIAPFTGGPGIFSASFGPGDINAGLSDSRFTAYQKVVNGLTSTLRLYKPAGSNSELQLTYTGLGQLVTSGPDVGSETWFVYGLPTTAGGNYAIPASGTATYSGFVKGTATPNISGESMGSLSGSANLAVNFGTNSFTGSMAPIISLYSNGSTINPGTYTFSNGMISLNSLSAFITGPGNDTGNLYGWFFGNGASEFGASFRVDTFATPAAVEYTLSGAIVGKKD